MRGLLADRCFVDIVAQQAEGEDGGGKGIAGSYRPASEKLRENLVVVL